MPLTSYNRHELGLNPLFSDREEERIFHDPFVTLEAPKQEPDRVYGLRQTRNFEKALNAQSTNDRSDRVSKHLVREFIKYTPFAQDGDPLLFPFLVLEAKSEKGQDGFNSIQMQTALSIRTLLQLQHDLQKTVGDETELHDGPLVWFISNKGEEWRVAAGFVKETGNVTDYVRLRHHYDDREHCRFPTFLTLV